MPEYYRIRYAQSADEVLTEVGKCVDYVKTGPVIGLLPSTLHAISLRDTADVANWQEQVERILRDTPPISATVLFWLNLLDELFTSARHRLDDLSRASHAGR